MRAGLAGRAFEREDRKAGGGCVRRYDAVVVVSGGVMNCCDDEVAGLGDVLREDLVIVLRMELRMGAKQASGPTLPPLLSTHIRFFLLSLLRAPHAVALILVGVTICKPGPSLSLRDDEE